MGKSLFRAVSNFFREKKDDAAEAISDPVRDAKYDIEDSKKQIDGFESQIQGLMKQNNNMKKDRDDAKAEYAKWEALAKKAAAAGNAEDVASCVEKKNTALTTGKRLIEDIKKNDTTVANLRKQLGKARSKIAQAESNTAVLGARLSSAKLRTNLTAGAKGLGGGPLSRLDDLEDAVTDAESDAEAWEELNEDGNEALEEKYGSGDADVDDEVARLMAEAGK